MLSWHSILYMDTLSKVFSKVFTAGCVGTIATATGQSLSIRALDGFVPTRF